MSEGDEEHAVNQTLFSRPDAARRGACPTLGAPMQTGDGLLARLRVAGNRLAPQQLAALARLALAHGNGLVEITARGNLQVRGLTPASAPLFARTAGALLPVETGLVVDLSPLAGEDPAEKADPLPLAARIRAAAAPLAGRLGPKVSLVIDSAGQFPLAALKADIRLLARDETHWAVTLGGARPQVLDTESAFAASLAVLNALAALGSEARTSDLFPRAATQEPDGVSPWPESGAYALCAPGREIGRTVPIALPFGQADSAVLIALCQAAEVAGLATLRLAPGHCILADNAPPGLVAEAERLGFVTRPDDPRRRISACIGARGCAAGHIAARQLASRLAPHLPPGRHLHVSGCAKGCAHPRPADLTLVGRTDGIGLVISGRAGDTPQDILDEAGLSAALAARQEGR